jgi:hypothetical protein
VGIWDSAVETGGCKRKLQDVASCGATCTGEGLNKSIEVVSRSSVTLYAYHLIIYHSFYPRSLVDYTITRLPIYLERG